jgi:hypothetical protein
MSPAPKPSGQCKARFVIYTNSTRRLPGSARKDADAERRDAAVQPEEAVDRLSKTPPSG